MTSALTSAQGYQPQRWKTLTKYIIITLTLTVLLMATNIKINLDINAITNDAFLDLYTNQARHLHLYGSAGSSKSHFAAQKLILRVLYGMRKDHEVVHRFVCMRKTEPEVRQSVFTLLADLRNGWGGLDTIMYPLGSMLMFRFANGSTIQCAGLDKPEKLKSIERPTGFWLEEATGFTVQDRRQVDLRMRGDINTYKQTIYTYNPDSVACSLYKDYHKVLGDCFTGWGTSAIAKNHYFHHSTYRDNRFLDAEYVAILENLKDEDEDYWRVFSEGLWGAKRHLIYGGCWRSLDLSQWPTHFDDRCYGLDFGFNNPTALVQIDIKDNIPYLTERIYQSKLTNTQLIELMDELNIDKNATIYADSAEPARIEEISDTYDCRPATEAKKPHAVKARIDFVKRSHMVIHPNSTNLQDELGTYKWKTDKDDIPTDEPVKFADHACNAAEYGMFEHMRGAAAPGFFVVK